MKKWFLISFIILLVLALLVVSWGAYQDNVKRELSQTQDTSMDSFRGAKTLVSFYPKYLSISSNETYQEMKKSMRDKLTESLFTELFYFDEFPIVNKDVRVKVNSIRGHEFSKRHFEFKLDLEYITQGTNHNFIYTIEVDNGKIKSIRRIK